MKSKRHLQAIEESKRLGISLEENPKTVTKLLENVKQARKNQYLIDGNILAKAHGYPLPYPDL